MTLPQSKSATLIAGCLLGFAAASAIAEAPPMIDVTPEGAQTSNATHLNARGDLIGSLQYGSSHEAFFHREGITTSLSLGGSDSYSNDLNDSGQVVGEGETAGGEWRGFLFGGGGITEIPPLPDMDGSAAMAINESGQIAGGSWRSSDGYEKAFFYEDGELTPITLGGPSAFAHAINERGDVLGSSRTTDGQGGGFIHTGGQTLPINLPGGRRGIPVALNEAGDALVNVVTRQLSGGNSFQRSALYHAASGLVIDLASGGDTRALAMNERGDVIGNARQTSGLQFISNRRAFLHRDGQTIDLTPPGASSSHAVLLNEAGDVVLRNYGAPGSLAIWRDGTVIPIVLDGYNLSASAINEVPEVVGIANPVSPGSGPVAFLWRDGQFTITSPGTSAIHPLINKRGDVAGSYEDPLSGTSPTYLFRDGLATDLGTLGGSLAFPQHLNERGFIAGASQTSSGPYHAFLVAGNRPPVAGDDLAYAQLNQPVQIAILENDGDAEGDPLEVIAVTQPAHGTVVINDNGTITYTATEAFSGSDTFTYTIGDGYPGTTPATVQAKLWADALQSTVSELVGSGAPLPADGKSLITLLNSADYASNTGHTTAAVGQLNAFIAQTEAFVASGKLTPEQGESLIEEAQAAIDSLVQ